MKLDVHGSLELNAQKSLFGLEKPSLRYKMKAFTLHAQPRRAERSRAEASLTERIAWRLFVYTRQPTTDTVHFTMFDPVSVLWFAMSVNAVDRVIIVNELHLRHFSGRKYEKKSC